MRHIGDVLKEIAIPITPRSSTNASPEPAYRCPICRDAGFYRLDVPVGHPQFGQLQKCSCRKEVEEGRKSQQILALSNLNMMSELTFENFDHEVPGVEEAYEAARAFAEAPDGWLLFKGSIGSGKTHLAVAIALEIIQRWDTPVLFMVVPDLLDHLRSTFDPANGVGYDERFEQVRTSPILILDDLGTENATPWRAKSSTRSSITATTSICPLSSPPTPSSGQEPEPASHRQPAPSMNGSGRDCSTIGRGTSRSMPRITG